MNLTLTRNIALGDNGFHVTRIQLFLLGRKIYNGKSDGDFGLITQSAVKSYQQAASLPVTGEVDNATLASMMAGNMYFLGSSTPAVIPTPATFGEFLDSSRSGFPSPPPFEAFTGNGARAEVFGEFTYVPDPTRDNPEGIRVTNGWADKNLVTIEVPELSKATNGQYHRMTVNVKAAYQIQALWAAWDEAGLLPLVKTWDGAYNPRFIRGSRTSLSNHAWGTAFDINYEWNMLGHTPAPVGATGCTRTLVPLAHKFGMYWGGHFSRTDGMHFEVAIPLNEGEHLDIDYIGKTYTRVAP